jgi:hypothetical protein
MGNLILQMGISLDGLVARPGKYGAGGWDTPPEDSRSSSASSSSSAALKRT